MDTLQPPFSNIQLELLQLFKTDVEDNDLLAIKKLISDYFAGKAISKADEIWDKEKWDEEKVQELLNTKMRTPYHKRPL